MFLTCQGVTPFYRQERVGKNGKVFKLLKLRTMVHDAETVLKEHLATNPEAREEWNRNQKLRNDPRIIKFGSFLRKSSMDELPQFWNVLVGEMSMIGPRPMMVNQQEIVSQHNLLFDASRHHGVVAGFQAQQLFIRRTRAPRYRVLEGHVFYL